MELTNQERDLLALVQRGLPLTSEPYAAIGREIGWTAQEVLDGIARLQEAGYINRMGIIVKHRALGYRANAMVVWDVPDDRIRDIGAAMARQPFVTLCYQRRRSRPDWPYNLFCMIHGRQRETVLRQVDTLRDQCGLGDIDYAVLFSRRAFKQRGARYLQVRERAHG